MKRIRNILAVLFTMGLVIFIIPAISASATSGSTQFPYVVFACDNDESIRLNASCITVNGNLSTNGTVDMNATYMNVNGQIIEHNGINQQYMANMYNTFYNIFYPSNSTVITINQDYDLTNIPNINYFYNMYVNGYANINCDININGSFIARDDVTFSGNVTNKNNQILGSKYGDVTINSDNVNVNCFVYAPNGKVEINSQYVNINGIIMAKEIVITCTNLNLNYSQQIANILSGN